MEQYKSVLVALLLLTIIIWGCTGDSKFGANEKTLVEKATKDMLHDYHAAMNKDGLIAEFDYLDDSNDFYWVPPGFDSPLTYDSVKSILLTTAKTQESVRFEWEQLKVYPLTLDFANYTGIVSGTIVDTANQVSTMRIIESGTLIRRADGWKLLNGQSAVLP